MAIKKREPIDQARLEAFAAGADTPAVQPATVTPRPVAATPAASPEPSGWPAGVPRTFLLRWNAPDMPQELAEIAALEDRSQHKMALKAMRLGLEALRAERS